MIRVPVTVSLAALLVAVGVGLAAAAAHVTGSETATRAAAELAMVHAVGVIALCASARDDDMPSAWRVVIGAMLLGAYLFSLTVGLGTVFDFRPAPFLAPVGGTLTIASWIGVAVLAAVAAFRSRSNP